MMAYWIAFVLMVGSLLSTLWLETGLAGVNSLALFYILIAIIISIIFFWAVADDYKWSWRLGLVLFAANLANAVYVYGLSHEKTFAFLIVLLASVAGCLLCLLGVTETKLEMPEPAVKKKVKKR